MHLNPVGIKVEKPPTSVDISDELLAEIIVRKLSSGYENPKRIIYEQQPLDTTKIVVKIDDYIRDSSNSSKNPSTIKSESAFKTQNYCKNGIHNPLTKHSEEEIRELHPSAGAKKRVKIKKSIKDNKTGNKAN
ncbi:hypothetical protein O181_023518 [Austropuccinia psidii MF-1]|uniref:Uncharacterized protein n=1 Tax=Austropuccinia psidii MF-1 TaxID=1389203 RepID=A0A9Q3GXD0_9BASI|nr:hypothetical protein [Austropuccinia psidii MF-1]